MLFRTRPDGELGRAVREGLRDKGCPLCGERAWDFGGAQIVFVIATNYPANVRRLTSLTGPRLSSRGPQEELSMKVFKVASRDNSLVQIACDNCGHTELLDAGKVGA